MGIEKEKVELTQDQLKVIVSFISMPESEKDTSNAETVADNNAARLEQSKAHLKNLSMQIEKDLGDHMGPSIVDNSPSLDDVNSAKSSSVDPSPNTVTTKTNNTAVSEENSLHSSRKQNHKRIGNLIAKVERKMAVYDQSSS